MKKLLFSFVATCFATISFSQFNCGDSIFDSGGTNGEYQIDENDTIHLCPSILGESAQLTFDYFITEDGYDFLTIYDSDIAGVNEIGTFSGIQNLGTIVAENVSGCLTLVFISDGSVTDLGWAAQFTCVAGPTCLKPTNLLASSVTDQSAELSWTDNAGTSTWIIEYGPEGFAAGSGTSVVANSNPFALSNLTLTTNYSYYVRAFCGGADTSSYSSFFNFQTSTAPFICGNIFTDAGGVNSDYAYNTIDTIQICPTNAGEAVQLVFSSFNVEQGYDFFTLYDSDQAGVNEIGTYSGVQDLGTITAENASGCLTVVFTSDDIVNEAGWEAQINCVTAVSCLKPTNLIQDSISDSEVIISWTENNGATSWIIEYGVAGFAAGTGNSMVTSSNPVTISGLTDLTSYDFYVRTYCGGTDTSSYSPVYNFQTTNIPFICGNLFTDAGGANGDYANDVNDTIVICPANVNEVVELVFSAFDTETNYDSLTLYSGMLAGQNLIGSYMGTQSPGTVMSQDLSGCITAVFASDVSATYAGWIAQINCFPLESIIEILNNNVSIYPNPSTGLFKVKNNFDSNISYEILDMQGRVLMTSSILTVNESVNLDLSTYNNGVYILRVNSDKISNSYSLVKE